MPVYRVSMALDATWLHSLRWSGGRKATGLMWDLKELFDPDYVLNPGVVLNHVSFPSHLEHCCKSCQFFRQHDLELCHSLRRRLSVSSKSRSLNKFV